MRQTKEIESIVKLAQERFNVCSELESNQRDERLDDIQFVRLGRQWDENVRFERTRPGSERPMLTVDRLTQFRNQVINDLRQNQISMKARPNSGDADEDVAEIINGYFRNIVNNSDYQIAIDTAVEDQVDSGLGYFRISTRYADDQSFDVEPCFIPVPDSFKVYFDTQSTMPDGSDANWALIVEDVDRKYFESKYPNVNAVGFEDGKASKTGWHTDKTVRVAEYFTINTTIRNKVYLEGGQTAYLDELQPSEKDLIKKSRDVIERKCIWYKIAGNVILEQNEFPAPFIPIIPVYGAMHWIDGKRYCYGLIRKAKDAQRAYNLLQSGNVELLGLSPKSPFIAAYGQTDNNPQWDNCNQVNYSVLIYDPVTVDGHIAPPPQRQPPPPANPGYEVAMTRAIDDMKAAIGMYDASLGRKETDQSGKAIMAQQSQAANANFHFQANLGRSIRHAGRILLAMLPKLYDTKRILRIMGEDGEHEMVAIDPNSPESMQEMQDEKGAMQKVFNPTVGKYDVYVDVGPAFATKRMESANQIMELVRSFPNIMQVAGDKLVRNLDIDGAEEIADRMQKMLPPQLQEMTGKTQSPEMMQATQHINQLAGQMEEMSQLINQLRSEYELKWYEAETKRIQALKGVEAEKSNVHGIALDNLQKLIAMSQPQPQSQEMQSGMQQQPMQENEVMSQPIEPMPQMPQSQPDQIQMGGIQ